MCSTCGCGNGDARVTALVGATEQHQQHDHAQPHDHATRPPHDHEHGHVHVQPDPAVRTHTLELEVAVLAKNDELATRNRDWLDRPADHRAEPDELARRRQDHAAGADHRRARPRPVAVDRGRPGDPASTPNASARAGARAVQVNTGAGCHLDATMVSQALETLDPSEGSVLFVENVGNLVCPALFDLGESRKVVVISVTEGDDKPLKYPHMFAAADLVVINKTDLLPYVDFDPDRLIADARS